MSEPNQKVMLGLKMPTGPRWLNLVEANIEEILVDHAYCEQKAASNAMTCIIKFPECSDLVRGMMRICQEEMAHFEMVHEELLKRGFVLGPERKDPYVHDLAGFILSGGNRERQLVERMLLGAMIEARSCERFRLLSEKISDLDLRVFYRELMESEADHYTTFIGFARQYATTINVEARWKEFLVFEGQLMEHYSKKESMHG